MSGISELQERVEGELSRVFRGHGLKVDSRHVIEADVPFYSASTDVAVKLRTQGLEIWLYDNAASYSIEEEKRVLERADYTSDEQFVAAFVLALESALSKHGIG